MADISKTTRTLNVTASYSNDDKRTFKFPSPRPSGQITIATLRQNINDALQYTISDRNQGADQTAVYVSDTTTTSIVEQTKTDLDLENE